MEALKSPGMEVLESIQEIMNKNTGIRKSG
jgi:hypothetical protein